MIRLVFYDFDTMISQDINEWYRTKFHGAKNNTIDDTK